MLVHWPSQESAYRKTHTLRDVLSHIDGWTIRQHIGLDPEIASNLGVDDFLHAQFANETAFVTLYVGYYASMEKVGMAHDPLVCFPGQGWLILHSRKGVIAIDSTDVHPIRYSSFVVSNGRQQEWVIYWFQSYDRALPGPFLQKVASLWHKVLRKGEGSALVRISIPIDSGQDMAKQTVLEFIQSFYPALVAYMTE